MRALMGLIKNEHGVWHVRRKVPKRLEAAVARVLDNGKERQPWLSRSLRTGDLQKANVLAKPVMMEFDRILADAAAVIAPKATLPSRGSLTEAEIKQIAEYHFATRLSDDSAVRREGWRYGEGTTATSGLSDAQLTRIGASITEALTEARTALARGNLDYFKPEVAELLEHVFRINLDRDGHSYRAVVLAVLSAEVRALEAMQRRQAGEVIDTPRQPETNTEASEGDTLSAAMAGWRKERQPSTGALNEYQRAITLFTEMHGNMPIAGIKRSHVRQFREALQDVPRHRSGKLLSAKLPELAAWGRENPNAPKLNRATINKLLGGVQAIAGWGARKGGLIDDNTAWADPFSKMRLGEDDPKRDIFEIAELNKLFASPVFARGERPMGGKGEAAFWLPLLGLFTGARRGELAAVTVRDVQLHSEGTTLAINEDRSRGKTLKTRASRRVVPVHPKLIELGFLVFVAHQRKARGDSAWLFPLIAPDAPGGAKAWSKWFSRYLRGDVGITDTAKVFHSLRHNFKDGLRAGSVGEDVIDALAGHGTRGTVARGYGSKDMMKRFGLPVLESAIRKAEFPGLDLASVKRWLGKEHATASGHRARKGRRGRQRET